MTTREEAYKRIDRACENGREICLIVWAIPDVVQACLDHDKTISEEDAVNVLNLVEGKHDPSYGVNWDTLWIFAQDVIAMREEEKEIAVATSVLPSSDVKPAETGVKYPEIEVTLVGQDGNAFAILGAVSKAMRRGGVANDKVKEFMGEAMSGDYDHLLQTCMKWVNVN